MHARDDLYVGTKKQAQEVFAEQARRVGTPSRSSVAGWHADDLSTVYKRLQRLKELEEIDFGDVAAPA